MPYITTQVRIVIKPGAMLINLEDIVNVLLHDTGATINDDTFFIQNSGRVIDVQYVSSKRNKATYETVWQLFGAGTGKIPENLDLLECIPSVTPLDSIWVRTQNGLFENDRMRVFTECHDIERTHMAAMYAFDRIKFVWETKPDLIPEFWDVTENGTFHNIGGKYHIGNPRYIDRDNGFRQYHLTPTTPTFNIYKKDRYDIFLGHVIADMSLIQFFARHYARSVELLWKNRIVQLWVNSQCDNQTGWNAYYLDHWDNLVNPEWLVYRQATGLEE